MDISCRLELLPGKKVIDKLNAGAQFGLDAVALPGRFIDTYIDELKSSYKYSPLPFSSLSLGFDGSLLSPFEEVRKKCRKSLLMLFDLCAEFSIPNFNMPPVLIEDNPERIKAKQEQFSLLCKQLPCLADEAGKRGVRILLEPVNRYESEFLNTLGEATEICEKIKHENVGITADFFHMQLEELNFMDPVIKAGKWIKYVHVADNVRVEPGVGSLDFKSAFKSLQSIDYSGFIEIESRTLSGSPEKVLPESISFLKRLSTIHSIK